MSTKTTLSIIVSSALSAFVIAACSGGASTGNTPDPAPQPDLAMPAAPDMAFRTSVGGNVSGLRGSGLSLQLNGGQDLPLTADGSFVFVETIPGRTSYAVTVKTQPIMPAQTCTVMEGAGSAETASVSNVSVVCSVNSYKVGGSVSGLGGTVVLQNNAGDDLMVMQSGTFAFATAVASGAGYAVTVKTHPANQLCTVAMATGSVTNADITQIAVSCGTPRTCKAIKAALPASADGNYMIDPDGAGALPAISAFCDMTTDGGGYTMYPITGGISTRTIDEVNSCDAVGLKMIIPRTKAHLGAMWKKYGASYFATVPGVYGKAAGNYTGCVMNSGDATCGANWVALDGGAWFLRDGAYSEPNGDYTKNYWLGVTTGLDANGNLGFNDLTGGYASGTQYVCSDNAK